LKFLLFEKGQDASISAEKQSYSNKRLTLAKKLSKNTFFSFE
jgi:hypothetical protein